VPLPVRPLGPADAAGVAALLERLSPQSLYLRFCSPIAKVAPSTVRHLAHIDQRHQAVGAFDDGVLIGTAHYFRSIEDSSRAEICVEIDDAHQHRGVGTTLLRRLAELARREGIDCFTATALVENRAVVKLIRQLNWPLVTSVSGPELNVALALPA
jgi:RimJ/RimL family protein N-acetyltransferase